VQVSATAIALSGTFTDAWMDRVAEKTLNADLIVRQQGTGGLALGPAVNPPAGGVIVGRANSNTTHGNNSRADVLGSVSMFNEDTSGYYFFNLATLPVAFRSTSTDPRHTLNSTTRIRHTPVAGGVVNEVAGAVFKVIANAAVINAGDTVEYVAAGGQRVQAAAAGSANKPAGYCITGGTGNAGGTIYALVWVEGVLVTTLVADTNGVLAGQYIYPGPTINRFHSKTNNERSMGLALATATSGNTFDAEIFTSN
jgi:hypothetical protein